MEHLARAVDNGVARGHLVTRRSPGSMLLELFTHAGVGTMITDDSVGKLRPARIDLKFKLNQNRSAADQAGVIAALATSADQTEREVAELMKGNQHSAR